MTRQQPRRPSQAPRPGRPRRVAGQGAARVEPSVAPEVAAEEVTEADAPVEVPPDPKGPAVVLEKGEASQPATPEPANDEPRRGGPGAWIALAVVALVLLCVGTVEAVYLARGGDEPTISDARPVLVPDVTARSTVDQAARAVETMFSVDPEQYDAQVDAAAELMTGPFAEQFRATKDEVRQDVVDGDVRITIDVSAQGVVSATEQEVVALVFFTQSTQRGTTGGVRPTQFRARVTMADTAGGWLVSDVQTL
jgi:Mce-associated membrane protein